LRYTSHVILDFKQALATNQPWLSLSMLILEVKLESNSVVLFTRFGIGEGPAELQQNLVTKYLSLLLETGFLPAKVLFYTDGVRLACTGSPVIEQLRALEKRNVELVLCKTCLDYFQITNDVQVGIVGGMGDILEVLQKASKVTSL
jgi:sulfur relay (sulfurtransferase) complex TusBCD TusD component (DsrE family)